MAVCEEAIHLLPLDRLFGLNNRKLQNSALLTLRVWIHHWLVVSPQEGSAICSFRLNNLLTNHWSYQEFETPWRPCDNTVLRITKISTRDISKTDAFLHRMHFFCQNHDLLCDSDCNDSRNTNLCTFMELANFQSLILLNVLTSLLFILLCLPAKT